MTSTPEPFRIAIVHGPNLNLLGEREPGIYGASSLAEIEAALQDRATELGAQLTCFQSNVEGELINFLHSVRARGDRPHDGVLLNAGAYAHTSLAIADAVRSIQPLPVVEIHLSNTTSRESIRHDAWTGAACLARVEGFGAHSYQVGLWGLVEHLRAQSAGVR